MRRLAIVCLLLGQDAAPSREEAERLFASVVHPVLKAKCLGCHGDDPKKLKGELDLATRAGLLKGGESGKPAVVAGKPDESPLYLGVTRKDDAFKMPPKDRDALVAAEVDAFRRWIAGGAPWPEPKDPWAGTNPADVWAFRPRSSPVPPPGAAHPVDAFLLERLRAKGLEPAGPADPATLLRRATFDLLGLPPKPEEIDAFLADGDFGKVVDRLLARPEYGEQWARHWLDVVRYADTSGFSNDFERPNAWRYRDYVVRSFNRDTPYDRFILEQLAGDELDPADPELLVAAGFLRMGPWEHTAMSVAALTRQHFLDDVTHATSAAFLGLTMRCARCHDHKFDPLPTRDYYRLQAVFASTQFAERPAAFLPAENTAGFAEAKALGERRLREKGYSPVGDGPADEKMRRSLDKVGVKRREHLSRELLRYEPLAFSVYGGPLRTYVSNNPRNAMPKDRAGSAQEVSVLRGGALESPMEKVGPGVLTAVPGTALIPDSLEGRRLALARWIASPSHPLTARVLVNRVWQHHFGGKGIVATPNNFGKMGKRPTHPELLDWLAGWFLENGSSIKKLHRLLMTSEAYRRSGAPPDPAKLARVDPSNDLLSVFPPRRLAAEEIRDAMLAVSGELRPERGGPGVFPEIHWEVALQPRHVMGGPAPSYQPSPRPEERHRRTIYAYRTRTLADPMLEVFNRPGTEMSCERRDETTVTPQAFALFNGQFAHDRALALAARATKAGGGVEFVFRAVCGRAPTEAERALCLAHVDAMAAHHAKHPPLRTELPLRVRREMIEEFTGEVVRWDEELDLMKGYVRDLAPWDVDDATRALADLCLVLFNSNEFLYLR
jgi:hypothetical protein